MTQHSEVEGLVECGKCKEVKPLSLFVFRSDRASNHRRVCRECEKLRVKTNYRKNVEWFKKRDSVLTPKRKARNAIKSAIANGKVKRGSCEVCGEENGQAHHDDYLKPMDVRFLCRLHHAQLHRKLAALPQTDVTKAEPHYECREEGPVWVSYENGAEKVAPYTHQDGMYANMCAGTFSQYCRCSS